MLNYLFNENGLKFRRAKATSTNDSRQRRDASVICGGISKQSEGRIVNAEPCASIVGTNNRPFVDVVT